MQISSQSINPANIHLFKVNNKNNRKGSKLTIKAPERRHNFNFEQISQNGHTHVVRLSARIVDTRHLLG